MRYAKCEVRGARHDITMVGTHGNASIRCEVRSTDTALRFTNCCWACVKHCPTIRIGDSEGQKATLRQSQPSLIVHHHLLHIKLAANELNHFFGIILRKRFNGRFNVEWRCKQ